MKGINSESVTLQRLPNAGTPVVASLGKTAVEEVYPGVPVTQVDYQDFFIDTVDYLVNGVPVLPLIGDLLTRGNGEIYVVVSGGTQDAPFDWTTFDRKRMRVHTTRKQ